MLVHLRGRVVREEKSRSTPEALAMDAVGTRVRRRRRYEGAQRLARLGRGPLADALPVPRLDGDARPARGAAEQTFRDWWRERGAD